MAATPILANAQWEQIRDHQRVFFRHVLHAQRPKEDSTWRRGGEAHYASGIWVSGDFFKTLEVPALRGRTLTRRTMIATAAAPRPL